MSSALLAFPKFPALTPALSLTGSDRRGSTRWPVTGHATAVVRQENKEETRNRICPLQLLNISDTGTGVVSTEPIAVGSQINVFVMPDGAEAGYDLCGTVVRCERRDDHAHHIGIRLSARRAA